MAIRATKDSSFAISNVYEQEVADTDWVNVIPKLEHRPLPLDLGDGASKPIESTATSLVSYAPNVITTGDYVKTYNATDGVVAGAVGTTTNVLHDTTGTHDIFSDASAVATYNLDGNALDLGGTYNGTASNVTYGTGQFGQAGVFNGSSSEISINITPPTVHTISCWIKRNSDAATSSDGVLAQSGNAGHGILYQPSTDSLLWSNGSGNVTESLSAFALTEYIHILFVYDSATTGKLYINGAFIENTVHASEAVVYTHLGKRSTFFYNGSIDQVRIFNRALTAGEVTSLYNEQVAKYTSDITALGLTTAPTKAWLGDTKLSTVIETTANRCQALDISLTVTGTPTTTTATGTSTLSGLLTTGDTVKLDANLVTTSGVVESEIGTTETHDIFGDVSAVATYNLDGDALDLGGTYNGTATSVTYDAGKFGQAGVFNGSANISIPTIPITNYRFSYSIWVKSSSTALSYITSIRQPCYIEIGYGTYSAGKYSFGIYNGSTSFAVTETANQLHDNTWHHIVMTHDGVSLKAYIDGVQLGATLATNTTTMFDGGASKIGSRADGTLGYTGQIDQARIFNRALTTDEVTTLYNEQVTKYQYALTYSTQGVAPTTITVPSRAEESTVATETYDTINDKLIKTYNDIPQSGRFLKYRVDGDTDNTVQKVQLDLFKGAI